MAREIIAKGGVLDGLSFTVEGTEDFTHHAAPGGRYRVNEKTATWVEDEPAVKAAKTRAAKKAADTVPETTSAVE